MTDSIDWLIFDLGGVVVDVAPTAVTIDALARRSRTAPDHLAAVLRERFTARPFSLAERFQIGELDEAGFHAALNRELGVPLAFDTLIGELEAMLLGEKQATVELIARLSVDHRLACYSNTNATHWRYMQRHFGFFRHLHKVFASQQLGFAKPDARGFEALARALDAEPQRCLLVDDRMINVDGARAAGWQALCFHDVATLEQDLARRGIRPAVSA